jgi:hypothetical protein
MSTRKAGVTIVIDGKEHRTFTQPPDPRALNNYLQRMFPGGSYSIVRVASVIFNQFLI